MLDTIDENVEKMILDIVYRTPRSGYKDYRHGTSFYNEMLKFCGSENTAGVIIELLERAGYIRFNESRKAFLILK